MVKNDARAGERLGKVDEVGDLRVVKPRVERQPKGFEFGKPLPEVGGVHLTVRGLPWPVPPDPGRTVLQPMANTPEAPLGELNVLFEHRPDSCAIGEVREADDRWRHHRSLFHEVLRFRELQDEFSFTEGLLQVGAARSIVRITLDEQRRENVVPLGTASKLVRNKPAAVPVPQVNVRVQNRLRRFEGSFGPQCEPFLQLRRWTIYVACRSRRNSGHIGMGHVRCFR